MVPLLHNKVQRQAEVLLKIKAKGGKLDPQGEKMREEIRRPFLEEGAASKASCSLVCLEWMHA